MAVNDSSYQHRWHGYKELVKSAINRGVNGIPFHFRSFLYFGRQDGTIINDGY